MSLQNLSPAEQATLELPAPPLQDASLNQDVYMRPWHWLALTFVVALSAFLNFFQLQQNGYGNLFYAAAVKSMLLNWHNFFFVSFDPAGFVSVDKPPVDLWLQTLSAHLFGFSGPSLLLPQALAGIGAVVLLFHLVRRSFGPLAGLLSALILATTPIVVVISRSNNLDMVLALVILFAAWAVIVAAERGQLRWLLVGAVLVGIGFNVKMLEAYLVVPALGLLYLLAAPRKWWVRAVHLALALLVLLVVSLSWVLAVDLTPAANRPYVDSTQTNSEIDLAIGYNGINRLIHSSGKKPAPTKKNPSDTETETAPQVPLTTLSFSLTRLKTMLSQADPTPITTAKDGGEIGSAGPLRLFILPLVAQIGWLLPLALLALLALIWSRRWSWPLQMEQRALFLWGTWLLTTLVFFTIANFFHAYYTVTMAPPLSALAGIGLVLLWRDYRARSRRAWQRWLLPLAFVLVALCQITVVVQYPGWSTWLTPLVLSLAVVGALALVVLALFPQRLHIAPTLVQLLARGAAVTGILALLLSPIVWSAVSLTYPASGGSPVAGPHTVDIQEAMTQLRDAKPSDQAGTYTLSTSDKKLVQYLQLHEGSTTFLLGTLNSSTAAPFILATGQPVMSIGGFGGNDPILTTDDLDAYIENGAIRFFLFPFNVRVKTVGTVKKEEYSSTGGQNAALVNWVAKYCELVAPQNWESGHYVAIPGSEKKEFRPYSTETVSPINRLYDCVNLVD